jgi:hypothetical protein
LHRNNYRSKNTVVVVDDVVVVVVVAVVNVLEVFSLLYLKIII